MASQELIFRSAQVLKQVAEELGLQGKEIAEYNSTRHRKEITGRLGELLRKYKYKQKRKGRQMRYRSRWPRLRQIKPRRQMRSRWQRLKMIKNSPLKSWNYSPKSSLNAASNPTSPNRDAKFPKLPAFVDEKDEFELESYRYLLRFQRYALTRMSNGRKKTSAIKPSALLSG